MMKKLMLLLLAVLLLSVTAAAEGNYLIVCPEGAPALAVASLKDHVQTIDAATIAAPFSSEEADFIIRCDLEEDVNFPDGCDIDKWIDEGLL